MLKGNTVLIAAFCLFLLFLRVFCTRWARTNMGAKVWSKKGWGCRYYYASEYVMASLPRHLKAALASTVILVVSFLLSSARAQTQCPPEANCGPGTCMPLSADSYECLCPSEFTGVNCESAICDLCENGASCDEMTSECVCAAGYTGSTCSVPISCDNIDCDKGTCVASGESNYSCVCMSGYTGANCDEELLPCDSSPCQNGGSCMEMNGEGELECQMDCPPQEDFICFCLPEYTGQLCTTQLSEYSVQCHVFFSPQPSLKHCCVSYIPSST